MSQAQYAMGADREKAIQDAKLDGFAMAEVTAELLLDLVKQLSQSTEGLETIGNTLKASNFDTLAKMAVDSDSRLATLAGEAVSSNAHLSDVAAKFQTMVDQSLPSNFKTLADAVGQVRANLQTMSAHLQTILDPTQTSNFLSIGNSVAAMATALQTFCTRGQPDRPVHVVIGPADQKLATLQKHVVRLGDDVRVHDRRINALVQLYEMLQSRVRDLEAQCGATSERWARIDAEYNEHMRTHHAVKPAGPANRRQS